MRGKIIVFEGTDSSGKATQSRLLLEHLQKSGIVAEPLDFPRYESFFGSLVGKYLTGEFGTVESLPPEFCALLFSIDRYQLKYEIESKLEKGIFLVANRYVQANIAFQTAKFSSAEQQKEFLAWIECLESRMPKADTVVFLNMPTEAAQSLMNGNDRKKSYRKGKEKDLHEANSEYLEKTRKIYSLLAKKQNWIEIECAEKKQGSWIVKPVEAVQKEVLEKLRQRQIIK